jgi:hypothetical protein
VLEKDIVDRPSGRHCVHRLDFLADGRDDLFAPQLDLAQHGLLLVSTLACEWGSRALRINALEVPKDLDPRSLHPLLRFVCGSAAQYLTGQTLACRSATARERR